MCVCVCVCVCVYVCVCVCVIETTNTHSAGDGTLLPLATSTEEVKRMIAELERGFNNLKNAIRGCLEKQRVLVSKVADVLTSLSPDFDKRHKIFIVNHVAALYRAISISEQFGIMNLHWTHVCWTIS